MITHNIMIHRQSLVNTDPQRRCYNGCHYSSELVWSDWVVHDSSPSLEKAESRLKFWTELNDYVVMQRGRSAKCEYKIELI